MKKKELIAVVCYNTIEFWQSRSKAIKFYKDGARCCDGCEAERYANIVFDLMDGLMVCEDGCSASYAMLKEANNYHQFPNGTNIRDYSGKVEAPKDTYGLCMELPKM